MRYYSIVLSSQSGQPIPNFTAAPNAQISGATWSSQIGGQNDPGALDIEMDIQTSVQAIPVGGSLLRIYGISLQQIAQAAQLNYANLTLYAGMAKGLPLAKPEQQGIIAQGTINPAYANWRDTQQTLDLIVKAPFGDNETPINIVHNQPAGMPLSTAIMNALKTALPAFTLNIKISPNLVYPNPQIGIYRTVQQYATWLNGISQQVLGNKTYPGVHLSQQGKELNGFDGTQQSGPNKAISFEDLVGQPTWLQFNVVEVTTAMRGDIKVGTTVTLPKTQAQVTSASVPQLRGSSVFQGDFLVTQARHVGRFRQPTGDSWVSIFRCIAPNGPFTA